MPQYLYPNKNVLKLAAPITASATTLTVQAGTGVNWPVLTVGQNFQITIMDAATGTQTEIVTATAHSSGSDSITIQRAQEGTTAKAFAAGDYVVIMMTTAVWNNFKQFIVPEKESNANIANGVGGWIKIATITVAQGGYTAKINMSGGNGYNTGILNQNSDTTIVLRTGNGVPTGLNAVAYVNIPSDLLAATNSTSSLPFTDLAVVNTSGNVWDVYILAGPYFWGSFMTIQGNSAVTVNAFGNLSGSPTTLPGTAVKGAIYMNASTVITDVMQTPTKWYNWNDAAAFPWIQLASGLTADATAGELMFGIGDNTLKIRGIVRGTINPGQTLFNVTAKRPLNTTKASVPYYHVWPSVGVPALNNAALYTERVTATTSSFAIPYSPSAPACGWLMVNMDILYW